MKLTLPKLGLGSLLKLPKFQSSIIGAKTPFIEMLFISLKNYRSVDVENGLAWAIWTSTAQVMAKRKVRSQIDSLTPDHYKSRINPTPVCAGRVQYIVEKLSRTDTILLQTSSQSEV
jgi:hypothetical protein